MALEQLYELNEGDVIVMSTWYSQVQCGRQGQQFPVYVRPLRGPWMAVREN